MAIVIVQGSFSVDPAHRDRVLKATSEGVRTARAQEGCLEYVIAADPLDPGRVVISERWESRELLDRHLAEQRRNQPAVPSGPRPTVSERVVLVYEVADFGPLD
ncbi:putative quinol monooxygenase [Streptomyces sp. NPDC051985]|uniref:putative quinol monooxygenase n=1 Tax=Streptomyces sp. NPDC051985 TaxID=3155807 RepID=UPI0034336145